VEKKMNKIFWLGSILAVGVSVSSSASAAGFSDRVRSSALAGNFVGVQNLVAAHPSKADEAVKVLLQLTQENLKANPDLATKTIGEAAGYAPKITAPSVPKICADVRRIAETVPTVPAAQQLASPVRSAAGIFAKAPVVVAAGRPNLCEQAFVTMEGPQLAAQPGSAPAILPPTVVSHEVTPSLSDRVRYNANTGDFAGIQKLVSSNANATDEVVTTLLKLTHENLTQKPDLAGKSITTAAGFANSISPPSVPKICADVRQIVEAVPPEATGGDLYQTIGVAAETFAKAPVVVAAGRPNLCEVAMEEAELSQQPGSPPNVPPFIIKPSAE
jgi:hypothetical protein